MASRISIVVVLVALGWFANDLARFYGTKYYADVLVLQKYSDFTLKLQPADMQPFVVCTKRRTGIQQNDVLRLAAVNRMTGCLTSYVFAARDEQGWPLQARGN